MELFDVKTPVINWHLKNIFDTGELVKAAVTSILETTAADGKKHLKFSDFDREIKRLEGNK